MASLSQNNGKVACLSSLNISFIKYSKTEHKISLILGIHLVKNRFLLKLGNNFSEVTAKDRENCHVRISVKCF